LCRGGNKIYLLFPSKATIYQAPYYKLNGESYYLLDKDFTRQCINLCQAAFPGEQGFNININEQPRFPYAPTTTRVHKSLRHPEAAINFAANKNLIDFYNTFPRTSWDILSYSSLSAEAKKTLYPVLRKAIEGKNEAAAANIIINFVQTGFQYQTDQQQFGYERPLFGDETLYYPYSDCEDRSILLCRIVKDILNLDAVLLHYPNHIAAAVCLRSGGVGDTIMVGDKCYTICDPTYVGSNIGESMPKFKNVAPSAIITVE
jgi:hypothetical protein